MTEQPIVPDDVVQFVPKLVYLNVNEDGEEYGRHDTLEAALPRLKEFPNDTVEVRYERFQSVDPEDASARVFQAEIFFTGCTAEQAQEWIETLNDLLSHNSEISAAINDMSLKEV